MQSIIAVIDYDVNSYNYMDRLYMENNVSFFSLCYYENMRFSIFLELCGKKHNVEVQMIMIETDGQF